MSETCIDWTADCIFLTDTHTHTYIKQIAMFAWTTSIKCGKRIQEIVNSVQWQQQHFSKYSTFGGNATNDFQNQQIFVWKVFRFPKFLKFSLFDILCICTQILNASLFVNCSVVWTNSGFINKFCVQFTIPRKFEVRNT